MARRALITGITGQDGAYLAQFLLRSGYEVFGAERRSASSNRGRLVELGIERDVQLIDLEMTELSNVMRVVERVAPDEVYNLAAQSFVQTSYELPLYTGDCNGLGPVRLLETIRSLKADTRFYQASTSEMFGNASESPQRESTPFCPRSPYAAAKLYAHWMTVNYRAAHSLHASCGILFNHESPLRGQEFVTRKITLGLAKVRSGEQEFVSLGNLDAQRDWGFAGDYVVAMWRMLQEETPGDYVIATGQSHSVRDFVRLAGQAIGFDIRFEGSGIDEYGVDAISGKSVVCVDRKFYRPTEVDALRGDPSKARDQLEWKPNISFQDLVTMMAEVDLRRVRDRRLNF
jgi:GDPmannose 4,6-dehydratase